MTSADVFVPSNGELIIRDNLADGLAARDTFYRKSRDGRRPETMGGYRFGQLSHSSFFTRHNPHPRRVNHMKGLLDVPICSVNDKGFFANAKYNLQFPPNSYNNVLLSRRLPVNAINVNSQLMPINTITGLQNFTGMQSYPYREKAMAQHADAAAPVSDAWKDELKALTKAAGLEPPTDQSEKLPDIVPRSAKKTVYSATTGRLIPPPSRMSTGRVGSKDSHRRRLTGQAGQTGAPEDLDQENQVMQMLCQILQTDDINAVRSWLVSAGMKEKNIVLDMIKMALEAKEDYYRQQYPVGDVEEYLVDMEKGEGGTPTIGGEAVQNRLTTGEKVEPDPLPTVQEGAECMEPASELQKLDRLDIEKMLLPRRVSRDVNKWASKAAPVEPQGKPPMGKSAKNKAYGKASEMEVPTNEMPPVPLPLTPRVHKTDME